MAGEGCGAGDCTLEKAFNVSGVACHVRCLKARVCCQFSSATVCGLIPAAPAEHL